MMAHRKFKDIYITKHAEFRAKERFSMNFQTLCQEAWDSLDQGIDALGDPTLRDMIYYKAVNSDVSGVYAHKGVLYFFKDECLVTLYPISWIAIPGEP